MTRPRHTGAGKIAAAQRAPRPTGILPIHACMINSDNEISDSEIISTGIPYSVPVYRYDELTALFCSAVRATHACARAQYANSEYNCMGKTRMVYSIGFSLLSAPSPFSLCTLHFHFHFVLGFSIPGKLDGFSHYS